jgi:hypothetical protein
MRMFVLAAAVALVPPSGGLGADKAPPAPGLVAPAIKGAAETQVSRAALEAAFRPFISDLVPRRVHVLGTLTIQGGNFGRDTPTRPLRMRMGGKGFGAELEVKRWTESSVEVVIPKGAPKGAFYVGVADARAQWVSAIDQKFEILPDLRDVAVSLDVTFRCLFDVLTPPPAIPITLLSPDGRTAAGPTALAAAGQAPGTFGNRVYRFTGRLSLRNGSYSAVADRAARFAVDLWDNPPTYWISPECGARRRVTARGAPLPAPMRQSRYVVLGDGGVTVTDDTTSLSLQTTVLIDLGSLPGPPPVCPPAGC